MKRDKEEDYENFEFECQMCGKNFPADPSGVIQSLDAEVIEDLEEWQLDSLNDLNETEIGEVYFVCPECLNNIETYDDGKL